MLFCFFLSLTSYCLDSGEINLNQNCIVLCWMLLKDMREDIKAEQVPFFHHIKYIFNTVLYLFHFYILCFEWDGRLPFLRQKMIC